MQAKARVTLDSTEVLPGILGKLGREKARTCGSRAGHQSDEAERISRASDLLRGFDHSFVFTSDEFIAELLSAAARNGQECLDSVRSDLFAIAISGVHSSAPGQPAPRYLSDKASAQELVKKYATVRPVRSFYEGIIEYAESSIERDSIRWEEEGDD